MIMGKMSMLKEINVSVIIMDRDFRVIGEKFIGKISSSFRYAAFINERGLHVPKDENNEDIIEFSIYQFVKK